MIDEASHDKSGAYDPNFSIKLYMTKQDTVSYERTTKVGVPIKCAVEDKKKKVDVYDLMELRRNHGRLEDSEDEEK